MPSSVTIIRRFLISSKFSNAASLPGLENSAWVLGHDSQTETRESVLKSSRQGGREGISGPARIVLEGLGFQKLTVVTRVGHGSFDTRGLNKMKIWRFETPCGERAITFVTHSGTSISAEPRSVCHHRPKCPTCGFGDKIRTCRKLARLQRLVVEILLRIPTIWRCFMLICKEKLAHAI